MAEAPTVTILAPVFDESAVVDELAERCAAAGRALGVPFEVLLVDDASTDDTARIVAARPPPTRLLRLPSNHGQLGATRAGLADARGQWVVVLDGDLQDPPEHVPALWAARSHHPVVFATKRRRAEGACFRVGRAGYGLLGRLGAPIPPGAGSFCLMRRELADRVAATRIDHANLAALLAALGARGPSVPYDKVARYDDQSRVGAAGLAREALGSLWLTGALGRLALLVGALALAGAAVGAQTSPTWAAVSGIVGAATLLSERLAARRRAAVLGAR